MLDEIINNANYLSLTIEDFRDFYISDSIKTDFSITLCINKCLK